MFEQTQSFEMLEVLAWLWNVWGVSIALQCFRFSPKSFSKLPTYSSGGPLSMISRIFGERDTDLSVARLRHRESITYTMSHWRLSSQKAPNSQARVLRTRVLRPRVLRTRVLRPSAERREARVLRTRISRPISLLQIASLNGVSLGYFKLTHLRLWNCLIRISLG